MYTYEDSLHQVKKTANGGFPSSDTLEVTNKNTGIKIIFSALNRDGGFNADSQTSIDVKVTRADGKTTHVSHCEISTSNVEYAFKAAASSWPKEIKNAFEYYNDQINKIKSIEDNKKAHQQIRAQAGDTALQIALARLLDGKRR